MTVRDVHSTALATSTALAQYYAPDFTTPLEVLGCLAQAGIRAVLVGTHALGGWMDEPRTSTDVDVLVATRNYKKAIRTLRAAFSDLEEAEEETRTRLRDEETKVVRIDVVKANGPLLRAVLENTHTITTEALSYRIPSLEMALALKFARLLTRSWADPDKYMDAHDFICMAQWNPHVDEGTLAELGELIRPGGGREIVKTVNRLRAGGKLDL
jgi:hypothetical protein